MLSDVVSWTKQHTHQALLQPILFIPCFAGGLKFVIADLAGLITSLADLFSTCIDCFDLIDSAHRYSCGSAILLTKLEIEKTRLLIWGEAVGILESVDGTRDPQLHKTKVRPTIEIILVCIKMLFTDAENLKSKYGLQQIGIWSENTPDVW